MNKPLKLNLGFAAFGVTWGVVAFVMRKRAKKDHEAKLAIAKARLEEWDNYIAKLQTLNDDLDRRIKIGTDAIFNDIVRTEFPDS